MAWAQNRPMPQPKRTSAQKSSRARDVKRSVLRASGTRLHLFNSGLEVWLYDDANRETIRDTEPDSGAGGMPGGFENLTRKGLIVGYSLHQDDELDIEVHVGAPLTESELSAARWLEPQTALLRLPSGKLCIEPNDSSRIGPEEPTDKGGLVEVPAGDYRLTFYRIDHEALFREKTEWAGPQEVVVLTPGGKASQAAKDLLPFQQRRDLEWVAKYKIDGKRAEALAWFSDYWDTCILNLNSTAIAKLGLKPGMYFQVHVPAAGVTLINAFAESWTEGRKLRPPAGAPLENYGYASLSPMADWNGEEALFCRREKAKTRIEAEHHDLWLPAIVDVLEAEPLAKKAGGALSPSALEQKEYFDASFLGLVLSDLLPGADDEDEFPLPAALDVLGKKLKSLGFLPQGDLEWEEESELGDSMEFCCRLYSGKDGVWALVFATAAIFDFVFITEFKDGTWIATGLADDFENLVNNARSKGVANEGVTIECMDEEIGSILKAHRAAVRDADQRPTASPTTIEECTSAFARFKKAAFG
jgi:hypothetical protein